MTTVYFFESSELVKNYVMEIGTAWVQKSDCAICRKLDLYISRVTTIEIVSAISRRSRGGSIAPLDAALAINQFKADAARDYRVVELSPVSAMRAQTLAETYFLRGYDAVQLSSALPVRDQLLSIGARIHFVIVSADNNLNAAAQMEGLLIENLNNHP